MQNFVLFRLIINCSLYLLFNYFYLREKINIDYLHNPNIDSVERSQLFNAMIHLVILSLLKTSVLRFRTVLIVFCGSLYCIAYARLLYENLFK